MSNFGLSCDVCNRENVGITWVNGMKFCAKCYQETFGNQQNKESSELLVNSLAEKDRQITELQKQLEEKEKLLQYGMTEIKKLHKRINDIVKRDEKLFKSQPAEIVEKIRKFCLTDHKFKECEIYLREDNGQTIYSFLDDILKEYQK